MKLLRQLYFIHSPSRREKNMSQFIQHYLKKRGIKYRTLGNQVYNILPDTVLLSAHIDQVGRTPITFLFENNKGIAGDGNLGADDKNGVWILLKVLEEFNGRVSFIFSDQEESGGNIKQIFNLDKTKKIIETIKYALVLDRRGNSDIIGARNDYCVEDLEADIEQVSDDHNLGYKIERGLWSDADEISNHVSCVNLSVGYHAPHSTFEYTIKKELYNALILTKLILKKVTKKYPKPTKETYNEYYRWSGWNNSWRDGWYDGYNTYQKYGYASTASNYHQEYQDSPDVEYYDESGVLHRVFYDLSMLGVMEEETDEIYYCTYCHIILDDTNVEYKLLNIPHCPDCHRQVSILSEANDINSVSGWFCTECDKFYRKDADNPQDNVCINCATTMLEVDDLDEEWFEEDEEEQQQKLLDWKQ